MARVRHRSATNWARRIPGAKDKRGYQKYNVKTDWRCTTKPGKLYISFFKWPSSAFELDKVQGKVKKAYLLADAKHAPLKVTQKGDHISVALPATAPGKIASVMVLDM